MQNVCWGYGRQNMCLGLDRKDEDYLVEKEPSFTERDNWRLEHYSNIMKYLNILFWFFIRRMKEKRRREKENMKRERKILKLTIIFPTFFCSRVTNDYFTGKWMSYLLKTILRQFEIQNR